MTDESTRAEIRAELAAMAAALARKDDLIRRAALAGISISEIQRTLGVARTTIGRKLGRADLHKDV